MTKQAIEAIVRRNEAKHAVYRHDKRVNEVTVWTAIGMIFALLIWAHFAGMTI